VRNDWDDEQLLAALSEAIKARQAVPSRFIEMAKNAYAWHNIDSELAQLTYNSCDDKREVGAMRSGPASVRSPSCDDKRQVGVVPSETASVRALTFTSAHLTVELEVAGSSLLGQILPPRSGTLEIQTSAGTIITAEVDEIGCFSLDPPRDSSFRLHGRTADGADWLTGWITL
jgi:hypothetical protein